MTSSRGGMRYESPALVTRLDSLTALRFAAVLLVFFSHIAFLLFEPGLAWVANLLDAGPVGVSFFFILSGFVLTWSRRDDGAPDFYRRRFARIVPNHLCAWLLVLLVMLLEGEAFGLRRGVASLLLVHAWVPSEPVFYAMNSVTWSLSCEVFFYALFPVLLPVLTRIASDRRGRAVAALLMANAGVALFGQLMLSGTPRLWLVYIAPFTRLIEFSLGVVVALEVRDGRWRRLGLPAAGLLVIAVFPLAALVPAPLGLTGVLTLPFALLIAAGARADLSGASSVLRHPVLIRLGEWSFAFFLLHLLVLRTLFEVFDLVSASQAALLLWIPIVFIVGLLASIALFYGIERPFEKRLRPSGRRLTAQEG